MTSWSTAPDTLQGSTCATLGNLREGEAAVSRAAVLCGEAHVNAAWLDVVVVPRWPGGEMGPSPLLRG